MHIAFLVQFSWPPLLQQGPGVTLPETTEAPATAAVAKKNKEAIIQEKYLVRKFLQRERSTIKNWSINQYNTEEKQAWHQQT